jgi:hypothetical protein
MPAAIQVRVPLSVFVSFLKKAQAFDRTHKNLDQFGWVCSHFLIGNDEAVYLPVENERAWVETSRLRISCGLPPWRFR